MYESGRTCPTTPRIAVDFSQERISENPSNLRLLQIETSRLISLAYEKQEPGFGLPGGAALL